MGKRGGQLSNYSKATGTSKGVITSKLLRDNPIVTNPAMLINRQIFNLGKRLLDFLPKMANHLSIAKAKQIEDPSARLLKYSLTLDNKIFSMILLGHDKSSEEKGKYCSFICEELGASWAQFSKNLIMFGWENGTVNILKIAEILIYLGAPEMYVMENEVIHGNIEN